ncbi:MAG: lysylphosphatidylglycerol synthase transmembrane domain-containing protein [Candidatus Paceibacterota bacterium]
MKKVFLLISSLILGALLLLSVFQQVGLTEIQAALFLFPKEGLVLTLLVNFFAVFVVGSYRWQLILEAQKCPVHFWKVMQAKMAGFTLSYITPSVLVGGEPVRAYMIKEDSKCGWEKSLASVIIDQTIFFAGLFVALIFGFIFLAERFSLPIEIFYGSGVIFLSATFVFYLFYKKIVNRGANEQAFFTFLIHKIKLDRIGFVKNKLKNIDATERNIERFFKEEKKYFLLVVLLALLEAFLDVLSVAVICFYLGQPIDFYKSLGVFFFMTIANFFPIPGSLGSFEFALLFIFELLGIGKETGLAFGIISRFVGIFFCSIGVFALIWFNIKNISHGFSLEAPPILQKIHSIFSRFLKRKK